jgi:hypothetical protein
MFEDSKKEASQRYQDAKQAFADVLGQVESPFTLNEDGTVVQNIAVENALKLQQPVKITGEDGTEITGQALLDAAVANRNKNITLFARIAALQSLRDYLTSTLSESDLDANTARDLKYQLSRVKR